MTKPSQPIRLQPTKQTDARVLIVVPNPATLKGFPVGLYGRELSGAFLRFIEAGCRVEIASPKGGDVELDFMSDPEHAQTAEPNDLTTLGFLKHPTFSKTLEGTKPISAYNPTEYDALFVVGGGSPLVSFKDDTDLHDFVGKFHDEGKVVGLLCHASCLLLWAQGSDGTLIANGKTWTGFSDGEEDQVNEAMGTKVQEYTIETEAKKNPETTFECADPLMPFAVRDGRLITGQQQNSTGLVAELMLDALQEA